MPNRNVNRDGITYVGDGIIEGTAHSINLCDEYGEIIVNHVFDEPVICGPRDLINLKWDIDFRKINDLEPPENTGEEDD